MQLCFNYTKNVEYVTFLKKPK